MVYGTRRFNAAYFFIIIIIIIEKFTRVPPERSKELPENLPLDNSVKVKETYRIVMDRNGLWE